MTIICYMCNENTVSVFGKLCESCSIQVSMEEEYPKTTTCSICEETRYCTIATYKINDKTKTVVYCWECSFIIDKFLVVFD